MNRSSKQAAFDLPQSADMRQAGPHLSPELRQEAINLGGSSKASSGSYEAIRQAATDLHGAGLKLITVIPEPLDANRWPSKGDASKPAFCGKNPSRWHGPDEPQLLSHKRPQTIRELHSAIAVAEANDLPIGLAVVPSTELVVVDMDRKDYESQAAIEEDLERLLEQHPTIRNTRIERTPSGGFHVYLRCADAMASWQQPSGKGHYCHFATTEGGPHRGEVLHGTRVAVAAPTAGYVLADGSHATTIVEVPDLAAIGIHPVAKRQPPAERHKPRATTRKAPAADAGLLEAPAVHALLGLKAKMVLEGRKPYGDDRSTNLAGFLRELYSVLNWLDQEGLPYAGSADELITAAAEQLDATDKADRVIQSIDQCDCTLSDPGKTRKRYNYLAGIREPQHPDSLEGFKEHAQASTEQALASFQALIQRLPDGWSAENSSRALSAGVLAEMLPAQLLRFNEMDLRAEVLTTNGWKRVTDAEMVSAYVVLTGKGWRIGKDPTCDAVLHVARQTPVHPVRDYLNRIAADPSITPMDLNLVASRFFRADGPLYAAVVRKWLIGAAARALQPGCKMDYCLVLKGAQGLLKSQTLKALASKDWFCDSLPEGDKDFLQAIHSCWIYELAELEHVTSKRAAGHLKGLISCASDTFRQPYGRTTERHDRQSVFCATVNQEEFLRDDTGSRRYWVIPIEGNDKLPLQEVVAARDAIWKAAVIAHRDGELPKLPEDLEALRIEQNERFNEQDPWLAMVAAWMDGDPIHRWDPERDPSTCRYEAGEHYTTAEVLYSAGLKRPNSIDRKDEMRISQVLRQLGFERDSHPRRQEGKRVRRWHNPAQPAQPGTTSSREVVQAEKPCAAMDLATPAQPAQPKTRSRSVVSGDGWAEAASSTSLPNDPPTESKKVVQVVHPPEIPCPAGDVSGTTPESEVVQVVPADSPITGLPVWADQLQALAVKNPTATPYQLANLLAAAGPITTPARITQVLELLRQRDAEFWEDDAA